MRQITLVIIGFSVFLLVTGILVKMEAPINMFKTKQDMKILSALTDSGFANKISDGVYKKNGILVDTNSDTISTTEDTTPIVFLNSEIISMDVLDELEVYTNSKVEYVPIRGVFITLKHRIYAKDYITSTIFFKVGDK